MILIWLVDAAATIYILMIFIRAFMTWIRPEAIYQYRKFFDFIARMADPFLMFIRRFFPTVFGGVDMGPLIALFLIEIARYLLIALIRAVMIKYGA